MYPPSPKLSRSPPPRCRALWPAVLASAHAVLPLRWPPYLFFLPRTVCEEYALPSCSCGFFILYPACPCWCRRSWRWAHFPKVLGRLYCGFSLTPRRMYHNLHCPTLCLSLSASPAFPAAHPLSTKSAPEALVLTCPVPDVIPEMQSKTVIREVISPT